MRLHTANRRRRRVVEAKAGHWSIDPHPAWWSAQRWSRQVGHELLMSRRMYVEEIRRLFGVPARLMS